MSKYTSRYRDDDIYRFTIVNNQVIRAEELDDGRWEIEYLDANETYLVQDGDVLKIEYKKSYSEITRYSDPDKDGLYIEVSEIRVDGTYPGNTQPPVIPDTPSNHTPHGDFYQFSITNGIVHGVMEYDDGIFKPEQIEPHEFYTLQGSDVIKTEWKWGGQEITRYTDADNDGLFIEVAEQWVPDTALHSDRQASFPLGGDFYQFSITNGIVHGVMEYDDGIFKPEQIEPHEFYTLQGSDVIKTEWKWGGQEITRYTDADNDGLFIEVAEQWIPDTTLQSADTHTPLSSQELVFYGTENNDFIAVRATKAPAVGGLGADIFAVRDWGHVIIADFSRLQGDTIAFDTGYGIHSIEQFAQNITELRWQGDGSDLFVGLGEQASLTLIGIGNRGGVELEDVYTLS